MPRRTGTRYTRRACDGTPHGDKPCVTIPVDRTRRPRSRSTRSPKCGCRMCGNSASCTSRSTVGRSSSCCSVGIESRKAWRLRTTSGRDMLSVMSSPNSMQHGRRDFKQDLHSGPGTHPPHPAMATPKYTNLIKSKLSRQRTNLREHSA